MSEDVLEQFRSEWKRDLEKDTGKRKGVKVELPVANARPEKLEGNTKVDTEPSQLFIRHVSVPVESGQASRAKDESKSADSLPQPQRPQEPEEPTDTADVPLSALQVYEIAVEKERQGLLSDALTNYRKAFKLDSKVDQQYRHAFRNGAIKDASYQDTGSSVEETNYAQFVQVGHDYDPKKDDGQSDELQDMIAMMASLRMPIVPDQASRSSTTRGIEALPEEILHDILCYAIVSSSASALPALSATCQKFFLLLHDYTIWRALCFNTYHNQVYTGEGILLSSTSQYADYLDKLTIEVGAEYHDDWKRMFIEKPRVRYDGIYISTCHYTRPGVREESLDWTSPIHLVTYFRFLRFFPDGHCLSLLTPAQPREVVHGIQRNTKLKGVQQGRWSMTRAGQVSIEANGPANYLFFMDLQIKSSSRGRHNKLTWNKFTGVHPVTGEVTQFNLKNDKSHYFHKVKSYITN